MTTPDRARRENMDAAAKEQVGRFCIKVAISVLIALFHKNDLGLDAVAFWLALYAVFAAGYAVARGEHIIARTTTYWDEAMWLAAAALMLRLAHQAF